MILAALWILNIQSDENTCFRFGFKIFDVHLALDI